MGARQRHCPLPLHLHVHSSPSSTETDDFDDPLDRPVAAIVRLLTSAQLRDRCRSRSPPYPLPGRRR
eukprot:4850223-Prymnesium_polylepis.1